MAGLRAREADEAAAARVAAAKLRLLHLARDADRPPAMVAASASLLRAHPWRGLAVAFAAGIVLGLAPRRTVARLGSLLGPLVQMMPAATPPAAPPAATPPAATGRQRSADRGAR